MSYKTILVCLTNIENAVRLANTAVMLARKFDAHLVGLHTMQAVEVYPGVSLPLSNNIAEDFTREQVEEAEKIEQVFRKCTQGEDFVSEWRNVEAFSDSAADRIVRHARCADLVIVAQPDEERDRPDQGALMRDVILESGRPVLVIPSFGNFESIGKNILVGWSATREAARALYDAVPLMQQADAVDIFWVSKLQSKDTYLAHSANEIATVLDRRQVRANVIHRVDTGLSVADELLNQAADGGADLIVAGAYGHSKIYDIMVGAATSHLMKHMTVPVFFSR